MFYNYKMYFLIVLQALLNGHYRFMSIDAGGYGKPSDGGTVSASALSALLENMNRGEQRPGRFPIVNIIFYIH